MAVYPGIVLGKYRVIRELGVGAMGRVYEGVHTSLDQRVAIKVLRESLRDDEECLARFEREARIVARLDSPHIVKIVDVDRLPDGLPYMVMELLQGEDLGQVLNRTPSLPIATAVDLLLQACRGVRAAHQAGVVHRDIKPSNLFLARAGDVTTLKLMDFGVSKEQVIGGDLTDTTAMMGTPRYMSPEHIKSAKTADVRADVWALGVILYRCLSGELPYDGDTHAELIVRILTEPAVPLRQVAPYVSEALAAVVEGAMQKDLTRRFPSVDAFATALQRAAGPAAMASTGLAALPMSPSFVAAVEQDQRQSITIRDENPFEATRPDVSFSREATFRGDARDASILARRSVRISALIGATLAAAAAVGFAVEYAGNGTQRGAASASGDVTGAGSGVISPETTGGPSGSAGASSQPAPDPSTALTSSSMPHSATSAPVGKARPGASGTTKPGPGLATPPPNSNGNGTPKPKATADPVHI